MNLSKWLWQRRATVSFDEVWRAEQDWIRSRRRRMDIAEGDPATDSIGLALSGGGVRSATFNLGLIQGLTRANQLSRFDFLSTVSGGGYIGACLTWHLCQLEHPNPFDEGGSNGPVATRLLNWLRAHGKYLTPGNGVTLWSAISALAMAILVNLLVVVPWALMAVYLLKHRVHEGVPMTGFMLLALAAGLLALLLLIQLLVFALVSKSANRDFSAERKFSVRTGLLLSWATLLALAGSIPWAVGLIATAVDGFSIAGIVGTLASVPISGIVSIGIALLGRKNGNEAQGYRAVLLWLGLILLCFGIACGLYVLTDTALFLDHKYYLWVAIGISIVFAIAANLNYVSLHRYYRNRLLEAYLPYQLYGLNVQIADRSKLSQLKPWGPYPLVNTNLQTLGSTKAKYWQRGGDSFILAPTYSGSEATGYVQSAMLAAGSMNLATAIAVSGAAVDPNTLSSRSRPLSFLMALLNVRLGYWIESPRFAISKFAYFVMPTWYWYMLKEMFVRQLNEDQLQVRLSDGGHFENLGLYELVRRRCRVIVISDAGADPGYAFADLGRAIELVRVDFGAEVTLDSRPLLENPGSQRATAQITSGTIRYADGAQGIVLYAKATVADGLAADIYAYQKAHSEYPEQSTANQFFEEPQFEAYRVLGLATGESVGSAMAQAAS